MRYTMNGSWLPIAAAVLLGAGQVAAAEETKPLGPGSDYQQLTVAERASLAKRRLEYCERHPGRCTQVGKLGAKPDAKANKKGKPKAVEAPRSGVEANPQ